MRNSTHAQDHVDPLRREMEQEFRDWATAQSLTQETISILLENGVNSVTTLKALTQEDLPSLGLKLGQMALVRRLMKSDSEESSSSSVAVDRRPTALSIVRTLQVIAAIQ